MVEYFEIRVYLGEKEKESRVLLGVSRHYEDFPDDSVIQSKIEDFGGDYAIVERHYEIVPFA